MILISIDTQKLHHRRKTGVWYTYTISTAIKGVGNQYGSLKTPTGKHRIYAKIGDGLPCMTAFASRNPAGIYRQGVGDPAQDWILTRILWLEGMEPGKNKHGCVDTRRRYIYIHGTHEEKKLGTPVSHGCIRMCNLDMIEFFDHVATREIIHIKEHAILPSAKTGKY